MIIEVHTLAQQHVSAFLESPYKPFLMFLPFIPWAWLISSKLDKDARYFHLNVTLWNGIHLACGAAALAAVVFIPIFWVGWPVSLAVLAAPIAIYWRYRNQQVPASQRFELTGEGLAARMEGRRQAKAARDAVIQFTDAQGETQHVPQKDEPLFPVHMLAEDVIGPALDARASAVEIRVGAQAAVVGQIVDGVRYKREQIPPDMALRVVDYLKGLASLDVADRRRHQTGTFSMRGPSGGIELAALTQGDSRTLVLRLEFDRSKRLSKPFDALGLLPSQRESLESLAEQHDRHGIVLIGAPPGHGLTTSMYSFIGRHDAYTSNIKTLEHEIQLRLDGVDHVQWDPTNPDVDYATNLQSILRRDPDVVMLGVLKDQATARTAVEPGMMGPLIYVPQRAASVGDQIRDWVALVGDVKKATHSLRAVTNQRLLRTLCPNCRQSYQPTQDQLKKFNLHAAKVTQLYRPVGKVQIKNKIENCPVCGGSGYLGQTGVFEVFVVDDEARRLLRGADLKGALAHARRNKMIYLQEAALRKAVSGETTIDEVIRVTAPAKPAAVPAA